MVDPIDDIARQARQGSVSAIIQVLNEKLVDSGVRTRAIFADGVLQLLCEAATPEQLEQTTLVDRIRQILESIQPRNIRRININSRIVREQQLLWLEEVNRDPEHQLLWSQEITLARMNPLKRLFEDWFAEKPEYAKTLPKTNRENKAQQHFWRGLVGGVSFSLLLLLVGWVVADWMGLRLGSQIQAVTTPTDEASPTPAAPSQPDPFVQAVRIAEQAVVDGQSAQTPADWLDLAARWQRASDLMAQIPPGDSRYKTAQDRTQVYRQNSEVAMLKAERQRQQPAANVKPSPNN
ncbi:hypothetical protein H6G89_30950 [Oscillatoria sp. FACHB-1407]|uniref:hypothetical protein n=1 Tax=Oscillatoria sp. FACHB-1407 TaxID=2692847 RepID=UPI0016897746|nr:hypothetical protein [Oscillatoria sp. FACHB-1407]MBD2465429.1 hypothetical protein [Oscillatoria sp. FACHB-1407]